MIGFFSSAPSNHNIKEPNYILLNELAQSILRSDKCALEQLEAINFNNLSQSDVLDVLVNLHVIKKSNPEHIVKIEQFLLKKLANSDIKDLNLALNQFKSLHNSGSGLNEHIAAAHILMQLVQNFHRQGLLTVEELENHFFEAAQNAIKLDDDALLDKILSFTDSNECIFENKLTAKVIENALELKNCQSKVNAYFLHSHHVKIHCTVQDAHLFAKEYGVYALVYYLYNNLGNNNESSCYEFDDTQMTPTILHQSPLNHLINTPSISEMRLETLKQSQNWRKNSLLSTNSEHHSLKRKRTFDKTPSFKQSKSNINSQLEHNDFSSTADKREYDDKGSSQPDAKRPRHNGHELPKYCQIATPTSKEGDKVPSYLRCNKP